MTNTVLYASVPKETPKLVILSHDGKVEEVLLRAPCTIGRKYDGSKADIQLDCAIASRMHGQIAAHEDAYYYKDMDSLNGTFINGVLYGKDASKSMVKLENGDVLRIDTTKEAIRHSQSTVMVFASSYPDNAQWKNLKLEEHIDEVNIGRGSSGLKMDNQMISRNHASFFRHAKGWGIADHNSTNGVLLNNRRISGAAALQHMDVIRIADVHFIFLGDSLVFQQEVPLEAYDVGRPYSASQPYGAAKHQSEEPRPVRQFQSASQFPGDALYISIVERSVWQRFKKLTLLKNINLTVNSGEMVLILGGSGAGKTTFMNAVMGYEKADGQIYHGNTDIYEDYDQMKYKIGFVPQQDLLRGGDTVYATLRNAADMKMLRSTSRADKTQRIEAVLEQLGLQREQGSLVSKLSGGQRKRLSIAVEYIADPKLFFLDEPDSGLDGIMARSLNEKLRAIADDGKIVMVITHSPDRVAHLYDKVIVLAKSSADNTGYLAYYGAIRDSLGFFETDSLEGIVKRINRPDEGGDGMSDHYIRKYASYIG